MRRSIRDINEALFLCRDVNFTLDNIENGFGIILSRIGADRSRFINANDLNSFGIDTNHVNGFQNPSLNRIGLPNHLLVLMSIKVIGLYFLFLAVFDEKTVVFMAFDDAVILI